MPSPRFKPVALIPNLITTCSLACGLMAMYNVVAVNEGTVRACWLIVAAAILDTLDGLIARLTHTESEFGVQYDSLSDAIVFGTTPALLMFIHLRAEGIEVTSLFGKFAQFACIIYTICGALRLARFNTSKSTSTRKTFTGLPIPGAAACVVSTYLVARTIDQWWAITVLPFLMLVLAGAMVSKFPYHSFKSIDIDSPQSFEKLLMMIGVVAAVFALRDHLEWVLFGGMMIYVVSGPLGFVVETTKKNRSEVPFPLQRDEPGATFTAHHSSVHHAPRRKARTGKRNIA